MLTFSNTHNAIRAEQALLAGGVEAGVMPMPGQVSAGCGICLRIPPEQRPEAERLLAEGAVAAEAWYRMEREAGGLVYRREPDRA